MEHRTELLRKAVAAAAVVAIVAIVFLLAPPASRLIIALLALPLEAMILASFRGNSGDRLTH